jgi:hypothetical protein
MTDQELKSEEINMLNQSPLENLLTYAITFAVGAASVVLVSAYGRWMRAQGRHSH